MLRLVAPLFSRCTVERRQGEATIQWVSDAHMTAEDNFNFCKRSLYLDPFKKSQLFR
jgi:hypothetical protein